MCEYFQKRIDDFDWDLLKPTNIERFWIVINIFLHDPNIIWIWYCFYKHYNAWYSWAYSVVNSHYQFVWIDSQNAYYNYDDKFLILKMIRYLKWYALICSPISYIDIDIFNRPNDVEVVIQNAPTDKKPLFMFKEEAHLNEVAEWLSKEIEIPREYISFRFRGKAVCFVLI